MLFQNINFHSFFRKRCGQVAWHWIVLCIHGHSFNCETTPAVPYHKCRICTWAISLNDHRIEFPTWILMFTSHYSKHYITHKARLEELLQYTQAIETKWTKAPTRPRLIRTKCNSSSLSSARRHRRCHTGRRQARGCCAVHARQPTQLREASSHLRLNLAPTSGLNPPLPLLKRV